MRKPNPFNFSTYIPGVSPKRHRSQEQRQYEKEWAQGHPFGLSPLNPIRCYDVSSEYQYLRSLETDQGSPLEVIAQALLHTNYGMLDRLTVAYLKDGKVCESYFYFDFQDDHISREVPAGFRYAW